jgi:hypothetical protein
MQFAPNHIQSTGSTRIPMQRVIKTWIFWLSLVLARPASAAVFFHLGYIDEEINIALQQLIRQQPDIPITVITDTDRSSTSLFQKPLQFYVQHINPSNNLTNAASPSVVTLNQQLQSPQFQSERAKIYDSFLLEGTPVESGPKRSVRALEFNSGGKRQGKDLIVTLKSPEFGRQPGLIQPLLQQIIQLTQNLPEARDGIFMSSFGTSGAVSPGMAPGTAVPVDGSLFFGLKLEFNNAAKGFRAAVRFFDPKLERVVDFYLSQPFKLRSEAEANLSELLEQPERLYALTSPDLPGETLKSRVQQLTRDGKGISLTLSYFGAHREKEIARTLGLNNLNMEDFHVLEVASRVADAAKIRRVTTDPASIDRDTIDRLYRWSKTAKYTARDYIEGILWGLNGTPLNQIPERARWDLYPAGSWPVDKFYISPKVGSPLDPFFLEMSVKFLSDAADGRLIGPDSISSKIVDVLSPDAKRELNGIIERHSTLIAGLAQQAIKNANQGSPQAVLRQSIKELVFLAAEVPVPRDSLLMREISKAPSLAGSTKYALMVEHARLQILSRSPTPMSEESAFLDIWVRASKWRNRANKLNYASPALANFDQQNTSIDTISLTNLSERALESGRTIAEDFAARLADRALYRAAMTPVTEEVGPLVLRQFTDRSTFTPFQPRSCPQIQRRIDG